MKQKTMERNLRKYLFSKLITDGTTYKAFTNKEVEEIKELYSFNIKLEELNDWSKGIYYNLTNLYIQPQIVSDSDGGKAASKIGEGLDAYIKNEFDIGKYNNLNKSQLGEYIYTYSGEDLGVVTKGSKLLDNETERVCVFFLYLSKFVEE